MTGMNDYQKIAAVIAFLDAHRTDQPDLATLADHVGLSQHHFHRLFSRWAGITPKEFLKCLSVSHAKELLQEGESVLNTSLDIGLSGPGRLHDLCVSLEAASPGELKSGGGGWTIVAGYAETPFGTCLAGIGPRGICHLSFVDSKSRESAVSEIRCNWPKADVKWDNSEAARTIEPLFVKPDSALSNVRAYVQGTQFQVRVWRALLDVPEGCLVSYGQLAAKVCTRKAAQAVGSAVSRNPLAFLIPCHRVIRETGAINAYRWGAVRKQAIVAWEGGHLMANQTAPASNSGAV